tara:strand:+ start:602 stop:838 length:237 start_codon:yes stop_codon:yes gene_type:complete
MHHLGLGHDFSRFAIQKRRVWVLPQSFVFVPCGIGWNPIALPALCGNDIVATVTASRTDVDSYCAEKICKDKDEDHKI